MNYEEIRERLDCYRMALDGVQFAVFDFPPECKTPSECVDLCSRTEENHRGAVDQAMLYLIANNQLPADVDPTIAAFAEKRILYAELLAVMFDSLYEKEFSSPVEPPSDESRLQMLLVDLWPDFGLAIWRGLVGEHAAGYIEGKGKI